MISSNIQATVIDCTWPVLMQYKTEEGSYIILVSGIGESVKYLEGTVIHSTISSVKVGTHSKAFCEELLRPFEGSLTLSNRRK